MATQPFVWLNEKTEGATGTVKYGEVGGWSAKRVFEACTTEAYVMMTPIEAVMALNFSYTSGSPVVPVFAAVPVKDKPTTYANGGTGYLPSIGDPYVLTGGVLSWTIPAYAPFCKSITPTRPSNDRLLWRFECDYGYNSDSNNGSTNPLRAPWDISLGMQQISQRAMFFAYSDTDIATPANQFNPGTRPLVTTAGDHFYDPPMQDVGCLVMTCSKNMQLMTAASGTSNAQATTSDELMNFDPTVICNFRDTTNAAAITLLGFPTFPKETCRMRDISVKPGRWRQPGLQNIVTYLTTTFVIEYCPIGWGWLVANRGPNYLPAAGATAPINDSTNAAVAGFFGVPHSADNGAYEYFLNTDGTPMNPLAAGFAPNILNFRVKWPADWSTLPLPPTTLNAAIVAQGGYTGGV